MLPSKRLPPPWAPWSLVGRMRIDSGAAMNALGYVLIAAAVVPAEHPVLLPLVFRRQRCLPLGGYLRQTGARTFSSVGEQRPDDAGILVRERHGGDVGIPPCG